MGRFPCVSRKRLLMMMTPLLDIRYTTQMLCILPIWLRQLMSKYHTPEHVATVFEGSHRLTQRFAATKAHAPIASQQLHLLQSGQSFAIGVAAQEVCCRQDDESERRRLRAELLRWHPDKFLGQFGPRLQERDCADIMTQVKEIAHALHTATKAYAA